MRDDLEKPIAAIRPLVDAVENLQGAAHDSDKDRDEDIILTLRRKLQERAAAGAPAALNRRKGDVAGEDKYEPQRLNRKICWQYDVHAKKVPLLRRHYI